MRLLPVLILLAAACYARASERFYRKLIAHPSFGPLIVEWQRYHSIPRRVKRVAVSAMSLSICVSIWLVSGKPWLQALLVVIGVLAATAGRGLLAYYMRHSTRWMPHAYVQNMESAGRYLTHTRGRMMATLSLFFVSPLSSAQLFAAAGIMRSVRLRPLLVSFAIGRSVTYSSYVTGAQLVKQSTFSDVVLETLTSPWAIAAQVLMVVGVIALGMHHWNHGNAPESSGDARGM